MIIHKVGVEGGLLAGRDSFNELGGLVQYLLGSGLVDYSQKMTVAARAMAEKKAVGQQS